MVPVFVFIYSTGDSFEARLLAAIVFIVAAFTDVLDGYVARKYNSFVYNTKWGWTKNRAQIVLGIVACGFVRGALL